jgi:hypothetical protein
MDITAGKRPGTSERVILALDEQNPQLTFEQGEADGLDCQVHLSSQTTLLRAG